MMVESVAELRDVIQARYPLEYTKKMLHPVPTMPVEKDRLRYLTAQATGKRVLDIGCTGPLADHIKAVASAYYGVDKTAGAWTVVDLDRDPTLLPVFEVDLVICAEVLEHLANPGRFLAALAEKYPTVPVIVTVPNAGAFSLHKGCEMVNRDHVCWYSYTTLSTLLGRYNYGVQSALWYNAPGLPHMAEGLIVHAAVR